MSDRDADSILKHFEGETRINAENILRDMEKNRSWRYDMILGQCRSCKKIREVPILIGEDGERIFEECACGGPTGLWIHDEDSRQQEDELPVCPECESELRISYSGLWD